MGLPGRFADWCSAVMQRLAARDGARVASTTWPPVRDMFGYEALGSTLDEVARVLISNSATHLVMSARQPDDRLRNALAERNAPFLVALDDPRNAAGDILAETGADPKMVVRAVANSCPLVLQYTGMAGALTVLADRVGENPAAVVSEIAAHFGMPVEPGIAGVIAGELAALGLWAPIAEGARWTDRSPDACRKMADGALGTYRDCFLNGRLDQIVWTRDLFYLAVDASKSPTEPLDLAGGRRILIYGPYVHLPAGLWTAQVVLGFSQEAAGSEFLVDVFADGQLAAKTVTPDGPGLYHVDLNFTLGEPSGKGVEVRVMVLSETARGQLAFGQAAMRPLAVRRGDSTAPTSVDFTHALAL